MKKKRIKEKTNIAIVMGSNRQFVKDKIPDEFEIWTLNHMCQELDRIDLYFDLHPWESASEDYPRPNYYYEYLLSEKVDYPIIKTSVDYKLMDIQDYVISYPLTWISGQFGMNLKNSYPMMILYAYYLNECHGRNIKNIFGYGSGLTEYTKYPEMGFSLYQAIGFVRAKGINFFFCTDYAMDNDSDIYGYYKLTRDIMKT